MITCPPLTPWKRSCLCCELMQRATPVLLLHILAELHILQKVALPLPWCDVTIIDPLLKSIEHKQWNAVKQDLIKYENSFLQHLLGRVGSLVYLTYMSLVLCVFTPESRFVLLSLCLLNGVLLCYQVTGHNMGSWDSLRRKMTSTWVLTPHQMSTCDFSADMRHEQEKYKYC